MEINNLEMISFRNHRKTYIDFDPGLTIIWGENGSGKTSILEAIHSLSYGKSFRTNNKKDLIKKGSDFFFIKGSFKNTENFNNTVSLSQDIKGNKKIQIDNKIIKKRKDLFGLNNVVVFSPEEEGITKGTSLFRRNYFDRIFSICSYDYLNSLLLYNKTIKQRNSILKNNNSLFEKEKELEVEKSEPIKEEPVGLKIIKRPEEVKEEKPSIPEVKLKKISTPDNTRGSRKSANIVGVSARRAEKSCPFH